MSNGAIILMHTGSNAEADALDPVMTLLEEKGYQLVTLSQTLK